MSETTTQPAPLKRVAILGTAPTWTWCPWQDKSLEIWGLNDAYLLGIPRADRWYDLHPFHEMHFRPAGQRVVQAHEVPIGAYLRPEGHLDWLKTRPIPVFLAEKRADYPTSVAFPKAELLAWYAPFWPMRLTRRKTIEPGPDYEVSSPAWMLMQAIAEGYQEIHIYGIHLATEWEYMYQRPNFEFLIGFAAGRGIKVLLPKAAPICRASHRYAFEPKADLPLVAAQQQIAAIKAEGAKLHQALAKQPWYARSTKADLTHQIQHLDAVLADAKQVHARAAAALHR